MVIGPQQDTTQIWTTHFGEFHTEAQNSHQGMNIGNHTALAGIVPGYTAAGDKGRTQLSTETCKLYFYSTRISE